MMNLCSLVVGCEDQATDGCETDGTKCHAYKSISMTKVTSTLLWPNKLSLSNQSQSIVQSSGRDVSRGSRVRCLRPAMYAGVRPAVGSWTVLSMQARGEKGRTTWLLWTHTHLSLSGSTAKNHTEYTNKEEYCREGRIVGIGGHSVDSNRDRRPWLRRIFQAKLINRNNIFRGVMQELGPRDGGILATA